MTTQTTLPGLFASRPQTLPFADSLVVRAFLLERDRGNILIYSTSGLNADAPEIERLGGAERHYLNHWHEAMFSPGEALAPVFAHEADRGEIVARGLPVRGTFSRRHTLDDDFEVIPTPGHTPGATAYLWDSGHQRFLFTGDSLYLDDGEWVDGLLESSDRGGLIESLELIRELDFDVLVPWAATDGQPFAAETDRADTRRRIDAILARLRRGDRR